MDGVQLSKGYRANTRKRFTFKSSGVPGTHLINFGINERLTPSWSHLVVLNPRPLDWESSVLTTRPLRKTNS